jgi:hypothetical protein
MPFAPVDPATKEKVIAAYLGLAGQGKRGWRNRITRELHEQGVQVSHGSVSNVINGHKRKHGVDVVNVGKQVKSDSIQSQPKPSFQTLEEPTFLAESEGEKENPDPIKDHVITKEDFEGYTKPSYLSDNHYQKGCPLSWFMNGAIETETKESVTQSQSETFISTDSYQSINPSLGLGLKAHLVSFGSVGFGNRIPLPTLSNWVGKAPIIPDQSESELTDLSPEVSRSKSKEADIDFSDTPVRLALEEEAFLLDSDPLLAWSRVLKQIKHEKDQRHHEMLLLERRKILLENEGKRISHNQEQLEHRQHNLVVRENIVLAAEPYLQVARQLQDMGLDIVSTLPWLETIREKAQVERINLDVAATSVAQELRNSRILGGLREQIEISQEQLKMINITIFQKEKALSVLAELQKRGVDIERLCMELDTMTMNIASRSGNGQRVLGQNLSDNAGNNNLVSGNNITRDMEFVNRVIEMGQPKAVS